MSRPAASNTVFSHDGMPAPCGAAVLPGSGWCPLPAGADDGGVRYRRGAGPEAAGGGAAARGTVSRGTVSTVPGRIMPGSGPMTCRLAAYRAGQPPRTASAAAIAASVSPGTTR